MPFCDELLAALLLRNPPKPYLITDIMMDTMYEQEKETLVLYLNHEESEG